MLARRHVTKQRVVVKWEAGPRFEELSTLKTAGKLLLPNDIYWSQAAYMLGMPMPTLPGEQLPDDRLNLLLKNVDTVRRELTKTPAERAKERQAALKPETDSRTSQPTTDRPPPKPITPPTSRPLKARLLP